MKARVLSKGIPAGELEKTPSGYRFSYYPQYLAQSDNPPISLTLPKRAEPYESKNLFPFFSDS